MISIAEVLRSEMEQGGIEAAIAKYEEIVSDEQNYFVYSTSPEEFLDVARELLAEERTEEAIRILKLALSSDQNFFPYS